MKPFDLQDKYNWIANLPKKVGFNQFFDADFNQN